MRFRSRDHPEPRTNPELLHPPPNCGPSQEEPTAQPEEKGGTTLSDYLTLSRRERLGLRARSAPLQNDGLLLMAERLRPYWTLVPVTTSSRQGLRLN